MKVILNGDSYKTEKKTLQALFEETHPDSTSEGKAIAVNNEVIPSDQWDDYEIKDDDRIEVIQAVQGG